MHLSVTPTALDSLAQGCNSTLLPWVLMLDHRQPCKGWTLTRSQEFAEDVKPVQGFCPVMTMTQGAPRARRPWAIE